MDLPPEAEEVAGFYGAMIETDHAQDATFNKNFFDDFKKVLEKHPPVSSTRQLTRYLANLIVAGWDQNYPIREVRLSSDVRTLRG